MSLLSLKILPTATNKLQGRLLTLAGSFYFLGSIALTLSPAVRARSWSVQMRWDHWVGFLVWLLVFWGLNIRVSQRLPGRDPYLLPIAAFLTAWGSLTIYRLLPSFGHRQSLWLVVVFVLMWVGINFPSDLSFLRRYKYLWLSGSLVLTGLTLFLGVNPMGYGPRMWLGCCGFYFQPSEPLKLLLIAYLAAYLADRYPYLVFSKSFRLKDTLGLLAPTLIMTGLALSVLIIQRDLGTASLFFVLYASVVYIASGRKRIILMTAALVLIAGIAGYNLFDVVKVRVDAWVNPWQDPSGGSYQIVQSVIAVANGGIIGRGPGLGSPGLVPLSHSDLIFSAIAEEYGLIGITALLVLLGLLAQRGLLAGLFAADTYRSYLAVGLITYLVGQSLFIIAGNVRFLPLTGITLPFVAYGGSSLITSYASLLLLMHISASSRKPGHSMEQRFRPAHAFDKDKPFIFLGFLFCLGIFLASVTSGWWSVVRAPELLSRTDNPRRAISDRWVLRGDIYDRNMELINVSSGEPGSYVRRTHYPELSNIVGYTDPVYGQSGLEAALDGYLRGIDGVTPFDAWWNHLIYGQPPPGLDIRLSIDLNFQDFVDNQIKEYQGAVVLMDASNGEILAISSSPTFNSNQLFDSWESLTNDEKSPLLNRASLGRYPIGQLESLLIPQGFDWTKLSQQPAMYLDVGDSGTDISGYSPLQIAWIATIISNAGVQPIPILVTAYASSPDNWVVMGDLEKPKQVLSEEEVGRLENQLEIFEGTFWEINELVNEDKDASVTWYVAGTIPGWEGKPMTLAVLIEGSYQREAQEIGRTILNRVTP